MPKLQNIHELSLNQTLTINTVYQTQTIITTVIQNIVLQDKHFNIQANKNNASYLYAQHSTNA